MSVIRIIFLGTPEFASHHLAGLLEDEHFEVVGVVTQPDRPAGRKMQLQKSPVKILAEKNKIPVLSPEKLTDQHLDEIQSWRAEAAVVVAFGQILSQKFLDLFPNRVVNVHGSLLPRWRGAAPIQRALMAGDSETGVALQVMVKKLDAGAVLGVRKVKITDATTAPELYDTLQDLGVDLLSIEFMDYLRGHLAPTPQDESLVTYAPKIDKKESEIDWSRPARDLHNHIRGMQMGPGSFTVREGKKLKLLKTEVVASQGKAAPGQLLKADPASFTVACGKDGLKVLEVQPESRSQMSAAEYLKGHPIKAGEILGK